MTEKMENPGGSVGRLDSLPLDAFVPPLIRRQIALNPSPPIGPVAETFPAAALVADVSGFSALAEICAQRGPRGAENLKDLLNLYFGRLVEVIDASGGQVIKFAGDATLALWPSEGDPSGAAQCAVQCALDAQRALSNLAAPDGTRLPVRIGIGVGEIWAACVGGIAGRWELLVAGSPLSQALHCVSVAGSGEVVVSSAAHARMSVDARFSPMTDGSYRVESIVASSYPPSPVPVALGPDAAFLLRAYVPRSVQVRLDAGQTDWLAEFRRVTALFINLGVVELEAHDVLDRLQRAVTSVQTAVYRYGGSINQLLVDDKGTVVVCGWGLALHAHSDDEVRALRAALDLRRELAEVGLRGSFGLATGQVFTGLRGNRQRCEYAMIGDVVNVAARLMQAAAGEILCDRTSYEGAAKRIEFDALSPIKVKGRERAVDVYRPIQLSAGGDSEMVGRLRERRALRERLDALVSDARGSVVLLEGDAGIGKSRLVADLIERAVARGVRAMVAAGDAIERSAPYHLWRSLFDNLMGLEQIAGRGGAERRVLDLLESNPRLLPFAPLLNPVLRLNFRETLESERVPPRGRGVLTRELLVHLLGCVTRGQPTLLVLEDAHWFDSGSWALVEAVQNELPEILLLLTMRPVSKEERPLELVRLGSRDDALVIRLDVLSPEETNALVCHRLRARVLSEPVARVIREKAEGHPFFIEELAYALRDRNLVRVENGECRFTQEAASESVQIPDTVQVVVGSRIDQLTVAQQLTAKVASVFGRTFDLGALRAAYPIDVDAQALRSHVEALVDRHLVDLASLEPTPTYLFTHTITQEVAYSLLPFALRCQLHEAVAKWYERQYPDDLTAFYPLLAHHWSRAEVAERALFYLEKAGEQALGRHASEEAVRFFGEAVEVHDSFGANLQQGSPTVLSRHRTVSERDACRIRWERRLGDASINLGKWDLGRRHFDRALTLLGRPLPDSDRDFVTGLGAQVLIQCARRLAPSMFRVLSKDAADLMCEAVRAYERVGVMLYLRDRPTPMLYTFAAALNLAEQLGPSPELAVVYADIGNILGHVPVRPLAGVYHRMAIQTATRLNDQVLMKRVLARTAVYRLGIGDWSACADLESEMELCDQIGDSYQWAVSATVRARAAQLKGEYELAAGLAPEIQRRAAVHRASLHEIWGITCQVWGQLNLGHHEMLLETIDTGLNRLETGALSEPTATLDLLGARALVNLSRGELDKARHEAERADDMLTTFPRRFFAELGMSAAAETFLTLWEAEGGSQARSDAPVRARRFCRHLERYSHISPPARARALLWRGCAEWLEGKHDRAHATWRRCLGEANRFSLSYEAARAHYEIGRRLSVMDPERRKHLALAEEGFGHLKAEMEVKRVAAAASGASGERVSAAT
jgi:class 3 adenylate cyclase/tetratricopeptide (TPR) repeat protein